MISSRLRIRRGTSPGALPAHACRARPYQSRRGSGACGTKTGHSPQEEAQVFLSMNGSGVPGKRSGRSPKGGVQASLWRSGSRTRRMIRTSLPPGGAPKSPTRSARKGAGCSKPEIISPALFFINVAPLLRHQSPGGDGAHGDASSITYMYSARVSVLKQ